MTLRAPRPAPMLRLALLLALLGTGLAAEAQERTVALTFDDLPVAGAMTGGEARAVTDAILVALAAADATASGFVNTRGLDDAGRDLLDRWVGAGHRLENHSHSHPHFNGAETAPYLADVALGHDRLQAFLGDRQRVGWYRAPFNETGETEEKRDALLALLADQGVRLAPFTAETADWMFNAVYVRALEAADYDGAARVVLAYAEHLDAVMADAERLSTDTFGREIPQILLLHANRLTADTMRYVVRGLLRRGYAVVPLDEAVADPAYDTPNAYEGRWGISWLHRWRVGLGLPNALRDAPEPPAWITEALEEAE